MNGIMALSHSYICNNYYEEVGLSIFSVSALSFLIPVLCILSTYDASFNMFYCLSAPGFYCTEVRSTSVSSGTTAAIDRSSAGTDSTGLTITSGKAEVCEQSTQTLPFDVGRGSSLLAKKSNEAIQTPN